MLRALREQELDDRLECAVAVKPVMRETPPEVPAEQIESARTFVAAKSAFFAYFLQNVGAKFC